MMRFLRWLRRWWRTGSFIKYPGVKPTFIERIFPLTIVSRRRVRLMRTMLINISMDGGRVCNFGTRRGVFGIDFARELADWGLMLEPDEAEIDANVKRYRACPQMEV
jgi:hypothetical protein